MKKYLKIIGFLIISCVMTGCRKAPINSRIEGHWLVESVTTLDNNQTTYPHRLYYSIGRTLTQLEEKQEDQETDIYIGRTEYRENETLLVLKDFVVKHDRGDQGIQPTPQQLMPYGIIHPQETVFEVMESSRHRLVIASDWAKVELKRF